MTALVGHRRQVTTFIDAARSARMHHAWLLAGPPGIGKAMFAEAAAAWLLARATGPDPVGDDLAVAEDHPTSRLIAAGSHPDFKRLERIIKDRTEDRARSISVDQVRALQPMFATAPSLSPARVILIDAVDDLERSAANALLKNLEEPPAGTIFLLVSHAPGRLLPTIRSRCRMLRFERLNPTETRVALSRVLDETPGELDALVEIADGAPGYAVRFAGLDIAALDRSIERLARDGDPTNAQRAALAKQLSGKGAQARYEAFLERAPSRIAQAARDGRVGAVPLWREARTIADRAVPLSLDPQLTVVEIAGLLARLPEVPAG